MKVDPASFSELYRIVGCINSILNISIKGPSVVVQSGFDYSLDYPVIRRDYEGQFNVSQPSNYDFYVTYLGETPFRTFLRNLKTYEHFNPEARYILIGEKPDTSSITDLLTDFVLNFLILVLETNDIFTVFPYQARKFSALSTELQKIGSCEDGKLLLDQPSSLFPNKIPPVWKRSTMTLVYSYEAPYSMATTGQKKGIEMDLLQLIFERIGMNAYYVNKNDPDARFDIRFGNVPLALTPSFDSTLPYSCDSAFWYVPQTRTIPKWKLALSVFSLEVNLTWFLSILFLCFLWDVTHVLMENKRLGKSFFDKAWSVTMILLEQGVRLKMEYATPSILIFLLLQSFLVLNSLYKAKYTFYLSGTNFEKTIQTLDEIMERGLKLGSTSFMIKVYSTTPKVKEYLQENFVECDTGPTCLNRSAVEGDLAVLKPYKKVAYIRDTFTDQQGHYQHHRLQSPVFTLCNTFKFPKGHPMYRLINRYVYLTEQHGFVQKIIANYDQIIRRGQISTAIRNPRLQLDAVKGPIFLIVIGSLIGCVVFGIENIYGRGGRNQCHVFYCY